MFKATILLLSTLMSASAFAPSARAPAASALKASFANEAGVQAPLGLWDPMGFLKNADQERFELLRRYEVKHGRVAMLAVVGHIVTAAGYRNSFDVAPGLPFSQMKAGLAAFETIPAWGTFQILLFVGLLEWGFEYQEKNIANYCKELMNEWGWSAATQKRKDAIEVNNGRAAQMGILTLMVHEKLDNNPYIINSLLGAPVPFNQ